MALPMWKLRGTLTSMAEPRYELLKGGDLYRLMGDRQSDSGR